ncbi:hypothetical protein BJX99DRAFT_259614 [Aspergillus californicus]
MIPNWRVKAAEKKLLPAIIDKIAQREPNTLWGEYPSSPTSFSEGFKPITYAQFANAVNGCAHFITKALGKSNTGEPLAWLAPNDPRCSIALVAAIKAGFKLFLISERNSVPASHKLLDDVECSIVLTTSLSFQPVEATRSGRELVVLELPPLEELLNGPQPEYPFHKDLSSSSTEVAFMVHTSGSTGFPKPMSITHEFLARTVRDIGIVPPEGYVTQASIIANKRCILLLPLGHPAGVNFGIIVAFFTNTTVILPLPNVPPTGEALVDILAHIKADWAALAPLTLETISKNMSLLDTISTKLSILVFSGGSLPKVFGDVISQKIQLLSFLGSSETGPLQAIYPHGYNFKNDWNYLQFPHEIGARFDSRPGGVYELVFNMTIETEPYQAVFASYPDSTEFRTKDLFMKHPTIPDIWTHASRSDDVIVFINGEKVNPVDFESHVSRHPDIAAVLMFGQQQFEAGLLIELVDQTPLVSPAKRAQVIKRLWPTIHAANHILPAYAHVSETHICFTEPGKPVLRTLKNTVRRQATLECYRDKIDRVYADVEEMWTAGSARSKLGSIDAVQTIVREALQDTPKLGGIDVTEDFFQHGLDSLQVLRLVRHLRLKTGLGMITPSVLYLNPSINALSNSLHQLAHDDQVSETQKRENQLRIRGEILQKHLDLIDTLASSKSSTDIPPQHPNHDKKVILLTGSTGTIASYILQTLMTHPDTSHIYCLNRSADSMDLQRHRNANQDPALPQSFPESTVTFLTADLTHPTFSISESVYETLQRSVTHVIHTSWLVDFNLPLQPFEPQLLGTIHLARFCAYTTRGASMVFISSISAIMNYNDTTLPSSLDNPNTKTKVPEILPTSLKSPANAGYAESKYIAERLLAHAAEVFPLMSTSTILRLGQIAGSAGTPGKWNVADWVPALVKGSWGMGVLPDSLDADGSFIDWVCVDRVARVVVEVTLTESPSSVVELGLEEGEGEGEEGGRVRVFHPLNPNTITWATLLPSIISALEAHEPWREIQVVSRETWVARLQDAARGSSDEEVMRENPALRLLDFFMERFGADGRSSRGLCLKFETQMAERASEMLSGAEVVDGKMMERWIGGWLE